MISYLRNMLINNFNLEESSLPLISVAADVDGVDRFGVVGRDESIGVVVPEG